MPIRARVVALPGFVTATVLLAIAAGCSGGGGGSSASTPTPTPTGTATPSPTGTAPATIQLAGTTETEGAGGSSPVQNATVEAYRTGTASALTSTTSDASGLYALSVPTGGSPIDGYLHASAASYLDSYKYPAAPFSADMSGITITLLDSSTLGILAGLASASQSDTMGWIAIEVKDGTGNPVSGAAVSTNPAGTVRYLSGGTPSSSASVTDGDGVAFVFNVPPGDVVISATKTGLTFQSHTVNARAGTLTYTSIAP